MVEEQPLGVGRRVQAGDALRRVVGALFLVKSAQVHQVQVQARASAGIVELELMRDDRQRAAGDQRLSLTPSAAREIMRQLQGRADEADRLAYQAAKLPTETLEAAVQAVAAKLSSDEKRTGASTPRTEGET